MLALNKNHAVLWTRMIHFCGILIFYFIYFYFRIFIYFENVYVHQTGKTTAIRRTAVRETGASQHHGGPN